MGVENGVISDMIAVWFIPTYTHTQVQHCTDCRKLQRGLAGLSLSVPERLDLFYIFFFILLSK